MPTAKSTSLGASVPNATRATPTSATSPAATHLPVLRQRPSGTSVYNTAIRIAVMTVICSDGIAQPPQLVRRSTPNGRARCAVLPTTASVTRPPSCQATSHTIRCRQRRKTTNATTSPGACSPPSHRTTASSATVTATAAPRSPRPNTANSSPTSTTAATSQPTPLVCSRYGNGGGAPVGRRRRGDRTASRRVEWTGGALVDVDWSAGASMAPPPGQLSQHQAPSLLVSGLSRLGTRRRISLRRLRISGLGQPLDVPAGALGPRYRAGMPRPAIPRPDHRRPPGYSRSRGGAPPWRARPVGRVPGEHGLALRPGDDLHLGQVVGEECARGHLDHRDLLGGVGWRPFLSGPRRFGHCADQSDVRPTPVDTVHHSTGRDHASWVCLP